MVVEYTVYIYFLLGMIDRAARCMFLKGELKPRTPQAWVISLMPPVLLRGIDVFLLRSHPEEVRFESLDLAVGAVG